MARRDQQRAKTAEERVWQERRPIRPPQAPQHRPRSSPQQARPSLPRDRSPCRSLPRSAPAAPPDAVQQTRRSQSKSSDRRSCGSIRWLSRWVSMPVSNATRSVGKNQFGQVRQTYRRRIAAVDDRARPTTPSKASRSSCRGRLNASRYSATERFSRESCVSSRLNGSKNRDSCSRWRQIRLCYSVEFISRSAV